MQAKAWQAKYWICVPGLPAVATGAFLGMLASVWLVVDDSLLVSSLFIWTGAIAGAGVMVLIKRRLGPPAAHVSVPLVFLTWVATAWLASKLTDSRLVALALIWGAGLGLCKLRERRDAPASFGPPSPRP